MDRKEYQRNYGQLNKDKVRERQRKRRALKKSTVGFGGADKQVEINNNKEAKSKLSDLFKRHDTPLPDNLLIMVKEDEVVWNLSHISVPEKQISKGCFIAVFNRLLTEVGLIDYKKLKGYRFDYGTGFTINYEIPTDKFKWMFLE